MSQKEKKQECYANRELSWLKFNERVLDEAASHHVPLCERMAFFSIFQSNLDEPFVHAPWAKEPFSLVVLDPARPGAAGSMPHLLKLAPKRLVYVSCNPVTAARDCQRLHAEGYRLTRWGLFDMFPHTGHVETILLFEQHA